MQIVSVTSKINSVYLPAKVSRKPRLTFILCKKNKIVPFCCCCRLQNTTEFDIMIVYNINRRCVMEIIKTTDNTYNFAVKLDR